MKIITVLFFLLSFFCFSQNILNCNFKVSYLFQYKFQNEYFIENTLLCIDTKIGQTFFLSLGSSSEIFNKENNDNTIREENSGITVNMNNVENYELKEKVLYKDKLFSVFEDILGTGIKYKEENQLIWQVDPKIYEKDGMKVQKATTTAYGRSWIAYFSNQYPLPYGPYKFNSLPGLITLVYDSEQNFIFKLNSIKKSDETINLSSYNNYLLTNKAQFNQKKLDFIINPQSFSDVLFDPLERKKYEEAVIDGFKNQTYIDIEFPFNPNQK